MAEAENMCTVMERCAALMLFLAKEQYESLQATVMMLAAPAASKAMLDARPTPCDLPLIRIVLPKAE